MKPCGREGSAEICPATPRIAKASGKNQTQISRMAFLSNRLMYNKLTIQYCKTISSTAYKEG